ncbi:MAG: hypothetical protein Hyperionvirus4_45 [Hyperionvirus sp.]|uniref:DUF3494 domain-containing protein n=1 Tax=Hyperionvirus sp. TaxID=2487770 RepID=A0A3G5A745_9VIRU|nr:MAG: hypothetical protein Hyperionvirus4_45 [Hyperionvirus sp.]
MKLAVLLISLAYTLFGAVNASITLQSASIFAVLAGSGITNTGTTSITGDVGTFPTISETGFSSVTISHGVNHYGDTVTQHAKNHLTSAYISAADMEATRDLTGKTLGTGGEISSLGPGVYSFSSSAHLIGKLTLTGFGEYVFKIGSTLTTASSSSVVLTDGANACDIFWQVGSSATLGTHTAFEGTVMALDSITANTGTIVKGRLLARNAAVVMQSNEIRLPSCESSSSSSGGSHGGSTGSSESSSSSSTGTCVMVCRCEA